MKIAVASDHGGYQLKITVIQTIQAVGHIAIDLGAFSEDPSDYPDLAEKVGNAILAGEAERGILICGSGVGACIAANKLKGVYAGVCHDTYSAHQAVEHDDMNVLCLGARVIGVEVAKELVQAFLGARYIGRDPGQERHSRRVTKLRALERTD